MIFTEGITLYHGSYTLVEAPDLAQCRAGKDFGRGFYLTVDPDQAAGSSAAMHIAIGRLIPERLKEQVCLRTQKALDCIRFCEGQEVAL